MAVPSTGPVSINNINVELGYPGTTTRSLNDTLVRTLAGALFGASQSNISLQNLRGKRNVTGSVEYLIVAGGGSGRAHGGGGGGGLRTGTSNISGGTTYTITVGGGGSPSSFNSISTTSGGNGGNSGQSGNAGGSGGGGSPPISGTNYCPFPWGGVYACGSYTNNYPGGSGNAGGYSPPEGNPGGLNGGGGAGSSGGGNGGSGVYNAIGGGNYSGGGAGSTGSPGGSGGGAQGGGGAANTGGGGGTNASGGSGVVVLRYPDAFNEAAAVVGSSTYSVSGGYRKYTFTGSGSITF